MKVKKIISQSRRDFWADYICEHCGNIHKNVSGYDDNNFHQNVIPKMKCSECNKAGDENYRPLETKYKSNEII